MDCPTIADLNCPQGKPCRKYEISKGRAHKVRAKLILVKRKVLTKVKNSRKRKAMSRFSPFHCL